MEALCLITFSKWKFLWRHQIFLNCLFTYKKVKSFFWYSPQLSRVSILCFPFWVSSVTHLECDGSDLMAAISFVYWYGRQHFSFTWSLAYIAYPNGKMSSFPGGWLSGQKSACHTGDMCGRCGWGRFPGERNDNPLQYSCLGNLMDRGDWWATVHGIANSQTWLSDYEQQQMGKGSGTQLCRGVLEDWICYMKFLSGKCSLSWRLFLGLEVFCPCPRT